MILEMRVFVDPALLRVEMPELVLRPGMTLAARVAERSGSRGILMLAGHPLNAQLPDQVKAGDKLRLQVLEASAERVVMKLVDESATALHPGDPTVVPVPLPDGRLAQLVVDEREAEGARGSGAQAAVAITYRSPALGAIDFRLAIEGGALTVGVRAAHGAPHELARGSADELREALGRATGRSVQVAVTPRHDPLDVYA
jgi:hypothetical protein